MTAPLGHCKGFDQAEYIGRNGVHPTAFIHARAEIGDAKLGARTRVWQFASVIRNAEIGEDCSIASCAVVDGAKLGNRVIVSHGAFIGPGIVIEDNVFIGPHVTMCNDAWPRVDRSGFDIDRLIAREFVTTHILAGASIGAGAVILPGVVIGHAAMIAAGSRVKRNVPAGHLHKDCCSLVKIDERERARMKSAVA